MYSNHYDVVLVGARISTLALAAVLAKRALRVLLVPHADGFSTYECEGRVLARRADAFGFDTSLILENMLREVNVDRTERALSPPLWLHRRHTFSCAEDTRTWEAEVDREFVDVSLAIGSLRERVSTSGNELEAWSAQHEPLRSKGIDWAKIARGVFALAEPNSHEPRVAAPLPSGHVFSRLMGAALAFSSPTDVAQLSALGFRLALARAWRGRAAWAAQSTLEHRLLSRIREYGGEVLRGEKVARVRLRKRTLEGLHLAQSGLDVSAARVVFDGQPSEWMQLLADRATVEGALEQYGEPRVRWYRYVLNIVVAARGVPDAIPTHVISEDSILEPFAHLRLLTEPSGDAERRMVVEALLPRRWVDETQGGLETARARIWQHLVRKFPFLAQDVRLMHSPNDGLAATHGPPDARSGEGLREAHASLSMDPVFGYPALARDGVSFLPPTTAIAGCYLVGPHNLPGLGYDGEFVVAQKLAEFLLHHTSKPQLARARLS